MAYQLIVRNFFYCFTLKSIAVRRIVYIFEYLGKLLQLNSVVILMAGGALDSPLITQSHFSMVSNDRYSMMPSGKQHKL